MPDPLSIDIKNLGVLRQDRWILRDINWSVRAGQCAAILGPNGSGKSTLTRVIAGHIWGTVGDVRVLGEHFGEVDLHALRRDIRLVQSASPVEMDPDLTAHQVVLSGFFGTLGLYDATTAEMNDEAEKMLDLVGLHGLISNRFSTLSSGERMRCLIARALVVRPKLLMLDEPSAGLDLLSREQVLAAVQAMAESPAATRPTIIMITHHLEELPPATSEVLLLDDGRAAAQGKPREVLRSEILAPVYHCPLKVAEVEGRFYAQVNPGAWTTILKNRA